MKGHKMSESANKKKYFFFDIDNTLAVGTTKIVPEDTKKCLIKLKKNGHFVSIATGRLQCDAFRFAQTLGIDSFVADGGQSLTRHGKIEEMQPLPLTKCIALLAELDRCHLPWAITTANEIIRYTRCQDFADLEKKSYFKTIVRPIDLHEVKTIYKIFAIRPSATGLQPHWQGLDKIPYTDHTYLIEPTDKAVGIRRMVALESGRPEDIVVFGDGLNDLTMFSPEWFSIAMGNGRPQLKDRADYVTSDCDKGGITAACKKFHWI